MSAYGQQLQVMSRQAQIQKELEECSASENMDRCIT